MKPPSRFELMRANRQKMLAAMGHGKYRSRLIAEAITLDGRTLAFLSAEKLFTLGDMYDYPNLLMVPNLGRKSLALIKDALQSARLPELS